MTGKKAYLNLQSELLDSRLQTKSFWKTGIVCVNSKRWVEEFATSIITGITAYSLVTSMNLLFTFTVGSDGWRDPRRIAIR